MVILGSFLKRACTYLRIADLRERFHEIEASMKRLSDGAAEVRLSLSDTRYVGQGCGHIFDLCRTTLLGFWMKLKH